MDTDIRIDVSRAKSAAVGKEHGVTPTELRSIEPRVLASHKKLRAERKNKEYALSLIDFRTPEDGFDKTLNYLSGLFSKLLN